MVLLTSDTGTFLGERPPWGRDSTAKYWTRASVPVHPDLLPGRSDHYPPKGGVGKENYEVWDTDLEEMEKHKGSTRPLLRPRNH